MHRLRTRTRDESVNALSDLVFVCVFVLMSTKKVYLSSAPARERDGFMIATIDREVIAFSLGQNVGSRAVSHVLGPSGKS